MTTNAKGIAVSRQGERAFVRVCGRGTFQNSRALRDFARQCMEEGTTEFVVDLADCSGLDSTFMGVLAGIGLRLRQLPLPGRLIVVGAGVRNRELLETLGLDRLLDVASPNEATQLPPASAFQWLPGSDAEQPTALLDKSNSAAMMLQAHEDLIRMDERNEPRFREVVRLLRQQSRSEPPAQP